MKTFSFGIPKFLAIVVTIHIMTASLASAHEIRPAYLKLTEFDRGFSEKTVSGTEIILGEASGQATTKTGYEVVWKEPMRSGERLNISPGFPSDCYEVGRSLGENTNLALINRWKINCDDPGLQAKKVIVHGLDSTMVDVFVEIVFSNGAVQSAILKPGSSSFTIDNSGKSSATSSYLTLGIEHLLQGFDHILFIVCLVLLVRSPLNLLKVVTSFTVAHSITLALATLGIVRLSQTSVEAVIALSIMFLAVELLNNQAADKRGNNAAAKPSIMRRYPWMITFVFGLLHGFGFAGALSEIGLPQQAAGWALLFFNMGVEIGQLIIVAIILVLIAGLNRIKAETPWLVARLPVYGIGTLAAFWFIERSLTVFRIV
jgi:hypothetical protein